MPTTANSITYFVAADGTLRDGPQGSIAQQPRLNYGTDYAVTLSFPPSTIAEGDQLQVALNRSRTFFSSASATGDAPVAAVAKHNVTAEEAAAQEVAVVLSTNTRAMIDQVNGIDHPVRGFFGVHVLRGQSFVTLAVADALMMSLESGPDAISPSLPVVDYPTREEAEALTERSENAAERAEAAAAGIVPPLQLSSPPTTSTVGSVGQLAVWHDSDNDKDHLYHLCFVSEGESATLYHWEECVLVSMGNVAGGYPVLDGDGKLNANQLPVIHGNSAPTTSTAGVIAQTYSDDAAGKTYTCVSIGGTQEAPEYNWKENIYTDKNGTIAINFLPIATGNTKAKRGIIWASGSGLSIGGDGQILTNKASNNTIDGKTNNYYVIVPSNIDYAVRSVLPNVTEIPAAMSDYSLVDSSATTNNHSMTYRHSPQTPSVYHLPAVAANSTVLHEIVLTIKFSTNVLTYEFQDSNGTTLVPLPLNGDIEAGSVVTFLCRYNPLLSQWVIYPVMDGKEAE